MKTSRVLKFIQVLTLLFVVGAKADDALNHWHYRNSTPLRHVKFVGNVFVGLGDNGVLLTSPDGSNWTSRTTGTTANLSGVAYANVAGPPPGGPTPTYIAVGDGGTVLKSGDTVNWSAISIPGIGGDNLRDVSYCGNFVVTAGSGKVLYSGSGTNNWTLNSPAGAGSDSGYEEPLYRQANNGARCVIAGTDGTYGVNIWSGIGGLFWSNTASHIPAFIQGIAYGNNAFVAVGWYGWPEVSTNQGSNWFTVQSRILDPTAFDHPQTTSPMIGNDVTFGNGMFIVSQANGFGEAILVTSNEVDWQRRAPANPSVNLASITFGNNCFVGVSRVPSAGDVPAGIYQSAPVNVPYITSTQLTNTNALDLVISGLVGQQYRLQSSTNLTAWADVWKYTNTSPTMEYIAPVTTSNAQLFYRVVSP